MPTFVQGDANADAKPNVADATLLTIVRFFPFDLTAKSRYSTFVLINEDNLAPFRGKDGLCRLNPEYGAQLEYTEYPKLLAEFREETQLPNLVRDGVLETTFTWDRFEELSHRMDHGIVAVLAFMNLVPLLPN